MKRPIVITTLPFFLLPAIGCATFEKRDTPYPPPESVPPWTGDLDTLRRHPLRVMNAVAARCEQLTAYRVLFIRQERRGAFAKALQPIEHIRANFRATPFSVKFHWLDQASKYTEAVYVAGQHQSKLRVRQRFGLFGLPPATLVVQPRDSVTMGESLQPITDVGLARMMQRALLGIRDAEPFGRATVTYAGRHQLNEISATVHRIDIRFPDAPALPYQRGELYIDPQSLLPVGVKLFLPGNQLNALYLYTDLELDPHLTDADFDFTPSKTKNTN